MKKTALNYVMSAVKNKDFFKACFLSFVFFAFLFAVAFNIFYLIYLFTSAITAVVITNEFFAQGESK